MTASNCQSSAGVPVRHRPRVAHAMAATVSSDSATNASTPEVLPIDGRALTISDRQLTISAEAAYGSRISPIADTAVT